MALAEAADLAHPASLKKVKLGYWLRRTGRVHASVPIELSQLDTKLIKLRQQVRQGLFADCRKLADECFEHRMLLATNDYRRIQIHTLAWEVYDALGLKSKASEILRTDGMSKQCEDEIRKASAQKGSFAKRQFPNSLGGDARTDEYRLWRQRAHCILSQGCALFRDGFLQAAERRYREVEHFLSECLMTTGFACSGTRARLHFFRAHLKLKQHNFDAARIDYDEASRLCVARLDGMQKIANDKTDHAKELAFAVYCMGKIHQSFGELEFHQGHLRAAERNLLSAQALLATSQDKFLKGRADMFLCLVARSDDSFSELGWNLLTRIAAARSKFLGHQEQELEARLEEIKTAVYLYHAKIPGKPLHPDLRSIEDALEKAKGVIAEAKSHHLISVEFQAMLVKARVEMRLADFGAAYQTVDGAIDLYRETSPPDRLMAEALVVKAKAMASEGKLDAALRTFRDASAREHGSDVFRASCDLSMFEILLKQERLDEANQAMRRCDELLKQVESRYLHTRFEELRQRFHQTGSVTLRLDADFNLQDAKELLERKYIDYLAGVIHKKPQDLLLPGYLTQLRGKNLKVSAREIRRLLKRHYPADGRSRAAAASTSGKPTEKS